MDEWVAGVALYKTKLDSKNKDNGARVEVGWRQKFPNTHHNFYLILDSLPFDHRVIVTCVLLPPDAWKLNSSVWQSSQPRICVVGYQFGCYVAASTYSLLWTITKFGPFEFLHTNLYRKIWMVGNSAWNKRIDMTTIISIGKFLRLLNGWWWCRWYAAYFCTYHSVS